MEASANVAALADALGYSFFGSFPFDKLSIFVLLIAITNIVRLLNPTNIITAK